MTESRSNEMKEAPAILSETRLQEAAADISSDIPMLTIRSGNTTLLIGIHFSKDSKETMEDKIRKLIKRDIETGNF